MSALTSWSDLGRTLFPGVVEAGESAIVALKEQRLVQIQQQKQADYERGQRLSDPIVYGGTQFVGFGDASSASQTIAALKGAAATANRVMRDRIASLEMGVFVRRFQDGEFVDQPAFDHPLQRILDNPTVDPDGVALHTAEQFWGLTVTQYNAVGESVQFILRDGLGAPVSLQIARPGTVRPIRSTNGRLVGYEILSAGSTTKLKPTDVVRIWDPNADTLWEPRGLMIAQSTDVLLEHHSTENWQKFYERDATPKVTFETDNDGLQFPGKEDQQALGESWFQRLNRRVGATQGIPAWVFPGWKTVELSSQGEAQNGVAMMQYATRSVYQAFGVPPSKVGDVVDANRAAAETNDYTFDKNTVLPRTVAIASALTSQLASQYPVAEGVQLIVKYQPFLMEDKEFSLRQETADLTSKLRSIDEVRQSGRGLSAVSWGGLPVGSFNEVPYTGEEEELDLSAFDLETPGDEEPEEDRSRRGGARKLSEKMSYLRAHFEPEREWQRQQARDALWTPRFQSTQRSLFRRQGEITLKRFLQRAKGRSFKRSIGDELAEELFPTEGWEELFKVTTDRVRGQAYVASADETVRAISGKAFKMNDFARDVLRQQNAFHLNLVNETTRNQLSQVLGEAVSSGQSTESLARDIADIFDIRRTDARRIARTEIAGATSSAQIEGYRQSGVVEGKQWNTSLDAAVRDSHQIEGQIRDLDDRFDLGSGNDALGPGDPTLPAADRANCRCFTTPVFIDEETIPGLGTTGSGVSAF